MTLHFRPLAVGVAVALMAASCGGDDTAPVASEPLVPDVPAAPVDTSPVESEPSAPVVPTVPVDTAPATSEPPPSPSELSELLFDPAVVHEISMEITDAHLDLLDPPTDDRVPVVLTVDGEIADGAGVRLKHGYAQFQGLDKKPGFSIETDEFVDGLELFDVDRFTLGNAAWDHSFIAEQLVYEVYRAAGIPAARTALARVTVNGETFGLYVMRETYNKRWLTQYFDDPTGNLYESPAGPDTVLEPRTNKSRNDGSDLAAIADVVATASDEGYRDAIEQLVDVDQLLTYWAIEALTAHWDGYAFDLTAPGRVPPPAGPPGNPTSNNFYVYHDPETDLFVFIPHGADVAFGMGPGIDDDLAPSTQVLIAPKATATIATRLWADPAFRNELAERIRWVLDEVWDPQALTERADLLADLVRANGLTGSREFVTIAEFETRLADRKDFLTRRADAVRAELASWESGDAEDEGN